MPVSADLLKALAEDPKSLEHQLGCMAGFFQIFDRQGLGRRYGSKRVSNAGSGQSQPTSACETPRHDHHHRNNHHHNPYWMCEEDSSRRISGESFERVVPKNAALEPHHRPAYSDSSELFTKSFETPTESRTSPDAKSNQSPMYSEDSVVGGLAAYYTDPTTRYPSFEHHEDRRNELHCKLSTNPHCNEVVPSRGNLSRNDKDITTVPPSSDIRDIVRASFERDHKRNDQKLRMSLDAPHVKNLPRSSSVDGKDRMRLPIDASIARSDLPRSSSVGGRGRLADWKDGLRPSSGSPRLTSKERDALIAKPKPRDTVTRLTVELKEGPRLSVSLDDRRASVDGKQQQQLQQLPLASPRPISRFRDPELPTTDFNPSLRAADIKEFLRGNPSLGPPKPLREGHRFSVDGTRDAPRASIAPRLSVDGRDAGTETQIHLDPKEANHPSFCRQSSGRKPSNVVARLMGLDELPISKDAATSLPAPKAARLKTDPNDSHLYDHELPFQFSPPPPPSPPDDYDYAHHESFNPSRRSKTEFMIHDHFASNHQQQLNCQSQATSLNLNLNLNDTIPTPSSDHALKYYEQIPCKPENGVEISSLEESRDQVQVVRKSPHGRRSLWHIFEAMQLKGLLHGSSRKKHAKDCQELKERRSQSLPPRLNAGVLKEVPDSRVLEFDQETTPRVLSIVTAPVTGHVEKGFELAVDVVVKPIVTRSVSCKLQGGEQLCGRMEGARKYSGDEETSPKHNNVSRAINNNVSYQRRAVNETPLQGPTVQGTDSSYSHHHHHHNNNNNNNNNTTSSSSSSTNLRQSRKERIAPRMTKSFSEVPQSTERDSSPRCPRGAPPQTNSISQERPASRSSSPRIDSRSAAADAISPRCPANMDSNASRVRRKPYPVKDREESKASLAHLRATATKQEFLKERASGDPDTPRLLRRSSSESKLLSKITESKPVNRTDTPNQSSKASSSSGGRSGTPPPNMSLLRSKRAIVSSSNEPNKSPMKSRPGNAGLGMKSGAKASSSGKERCGAVAAGENVQTSHANRPAKSFANGEAVAAQEKSIKAGVQVRATQGGALDQSGDAATNSNAREIRTESKAREKTVEIDEGVKTPRGVSIKKIDFLEDAQAEVAEQPSPVSVLDNSHFDEELTPSPKAGKTSVFNLQEQQTLNRSEKDRRWSSARFLDLNLEESTPALKIPEETASASDATVPETKPLEIPAAATKTTHIHSRSVCLKSASEETAYISDLLTAASLTPEHPSPNLLTTNYVINPVIFDTLEAKFASSSDCDKIASLDRRILFDSVNEVLERVWAPQGTTGGMRSKRRSVGGRSELVKEVLAQLEDVPCEAFEDVCDTVYVILQKDLVKGRGGQADWGSAGACFAKEVEEVGVAVEKMIVRDLIEETVREMNTLSLAVS